MLLHRPTGVRTLPKPEWHARITAFQAGEWLALLRAAQDSTTNNSTQQNRPQQPNNKPDEPAS
jgi:hypothetical protein